MSRGPEERGEKTRTAETSGGVIFDATGILVAGAQFDEDFKLNKLPDLRLLEKFIAVSRVSSMTAAAEALSISVAAVSQTVSRLEHQFGVELLERNGRGFRLTPAGLALKAQAAITLGAAHEMVDTLHPFRRHPIPHLRIWMNESAAQALSTPLIKTLHGTVGRISIQAGLRYDYVKELLSGACDVIICSEDLFGIPDIVCEPIYRERLVAIMPASLGFEDMSIESVASKLPLLCNHRPRHIHASTMAFLDDYGIKPLETIDCSSNAALLDLVEVGVGWAIIGPLSMCRFRSARGRVAWKMLPSPKYVRTLYLCAERDRLLDLPKTLADKCRTVLRDEMSNWLAGLEADAQLAAELIEPTPPVAAY